MMSRLLKAIQLAKQKHGMKPVAAKKKIGKCGKMMKSIESAQSAIIGLKKSDAEMPEDGEVFELSKAGYDAMFHHALHAKAAQDSCYPPMKEGQVRDESHSKKCQAHSKKHEFMMLRHALEEARKKGGDWVGGQSSKLRKYMDFMDGEQYDLSKDPEYAKVKKHYESGGDFKGHKDDKFKEDY